MTRKIQTLVQAVHLATSGKSSDLACCASILAGLPCGGWGETQQAMRQMGECLPLRAQRSYTVGHLADALYTAEGPDSGRYVARSTEAAMAAAARIEAESAPKSPEIEIVSGEGTGAGTTECFRGVPTALAVQRRLVRERCGGDRWAFARVDGEQCEDIEDLRTALRG